MAYIPRIRHTQSYSVILDVWPLTRLALMGAPVPSHCPQTTARHECHHAESTSTAGTALAQVSRFVHMSLIDISVLTLALSASCYSPWPVSAIEEQGIDRIDISSASISSLVCAQGEY